MYNDKKIEELIERFFAGSTSCHEEKELYSYFNRDNIPHHLIHYKAVFSYFDTDIIKEIDLRKDKSVTKNHFKLVYGIAASLLAVILLSSLSVYINHIKFNPYEGSYIVRNGIKIEDKNIAMAEMEIIMQQIEEQNEEINSFLLSIKEQEETYKEIENRIENEVSSITNNIENNIYGL